MKYFVTDTRADMGIRQLGEGKATLLPDGSLEYRCPDTTRKITVSPENWSTDWDKTVVSAYNALNDEIEKHRIQSTKLKNERQNLINASPKLQRITKQLKLL